MNSLRCALASLLLATGCGLGDAAAEAGATTARALGRTLIKIVDTEPGAVRASSQVQCETKDSCRDGGAPATGCVLRDPAFDADFAARFASCIQSCGTGPDCFMQATPPRTTAQPGDARSDCLAALALCQVESDACDALAVLRDPSITDAITACSAHDCNDLQICLRDAVLTPGTFFNEADAGHL